MARRRQARFPKGKPADPTENMTPEQAAEWEAMNEEYGDKFKDKGSSRTRLRRHARGQHEWGGSLYRNQTEKLEALLYDFVTAGGLNAPEDALDYLSEGRRSNLSEMRQMWDVAPADLAELEENWPVYADAVRRDLEQMAKAARRRRARFPKGKPADPTENMTPEQAAEWEAMNEEYGDKFKDKGSSRRRLRRHAHVHPVLAEAEKTADWELYKATEELEKATQILMGKVNNVIRDAEQIRERETVKELESIKKSLRSVEKDVTGLVMSLSARF